MVIGVFQSRDEISIEMVMIGAHQSRDEIISIKMMMISAYQSLHGIPRKCFAPKVSVNV